MSTPEAIPHEYPFRLVERVAEVDSSRFGVVLGTANGALTPTGIWPVTLIAEALAQSILLVVRPPSQETLRLVALDRVAVLQPIAAGDRLEVEVRQIAALAPLRRFSCRARRAGALAAVAEVTVSG